MFLSVSDVFKVGIGPSSSHTVGPMVTASRFIKILNKPSILNEVERIQISLHGSLAFTGKGHGSDHAIILGLLGESPETLDPDSKDKTTRSFDPTTASLDPTRFLYSPVGQSTALYHEEITRERSRVEVSIASVA